MDEEFIHLLELTKGEANVYEALLRLKKGTKTPIARTSGVSPSKVYDVLDRLIKKGLVTYFTEDHVQHFIPVHPSNLSLFFDKKMEELTNQKKALQQKLHILFPRPEEYLPHAQIFNGWDGLRNVFAILLDDLKKRDTYYILGANGGEDVSKAYEFFPMIDKKFYEKGIKRKVVHRYEKKHEAKHYFQQFGKKNWDIRYYPTLGPFEIGISNQYVSLNLLQKEPVAILINNKTIRNSFLEYFDSIWNISKK